MAKHIPSEQSADVNESNLYSIFERHHTAMLAIEPETGAIVYGNAAAIKFYGYPRDVLFSMLISQINQLPPDVVKAQRTRAWKEEQASFIFSHRLASGEIRTVEVDSSPVTVDGRVLLFSLIHDISERQRAEMALRESEDRYRSLVESSPDGVILHRDGVFMYANSAALSLYGAGSLEQLQSKTVLDMIHDDDRDGVRHRIRPMEIGEMLPLHETRIVRFDGRILDVETIGGRINYRGGYANQIIIRDISERKKKEAELHRLNRTHRALSSSSKAMTRATDEMQFMKDVCEIIREDCFYSMVWIGFAEHDAECTVRPVMYSGFEEGYLDSLNISWADTDRGRGPTGVAIRTGEASMCANMAEDPRFLPWRAEAIKRGYASSIAFPLKDHGTAFGALTIYSPEPDGFSVSEMALLNELAADLAYGIMAIRTRAAHARMEDEIRSSRDMLEQKVHERTKELQNLSQRLIEAQEAERRKIALELHDEIGQVLTAIQLNLRGIIEFEDAKDIPARLEETVGFTDRLLQQVRELSVDLRPWMLDQLGLVPSVRWYVDKQAQRGKIKAVFAAENIDGRFAPIIEITGYRVIQEAMTNILRHAQATEISVKLERIDDMLAAEIGDNGVGFTPGTIKDRPIGKQGLGTIGMKERITSLGGTIDIISKPGKGTRIRFTLPLNNSSDHTQST